MFHRKFFVVKCGRNVIPCCADPLFPVGTGTSLIEKKINNPMQEHAV
jgi:hypothetical protein